MGVASSNSRIKGNNVDSDVELAEKQLQPKEGIVNEAPVTTIDDITTSRATTGTSNLSVSGSGAAVDSGSQSGVSVGDEASVNSSNHNFITCTSTTDNNKNSGTGPNEDPDNETGYHNNVNDNVEEKEGMKVTYENSMNRAMVSMVVLASNGDKQAPGDTANTPFLFSTQHLQHVDAPPSCAGAWRVTTQEDPNREDQHRITTPDDERWQQDDVPCERVGETPIAARVSDAEVVEAEGFPISAEPRPGRRQARRWCWLRAMLVVLVVGMLVVLVVGVSILLASRDTLDSSDNYGTPQHYLSRPKRPDDYVRRLLPNYTLSAMELDKFSPQALAFQWAINDPLWQNYPEWRTVQRYALATFYYATSGDSWVAKKGWLNYSVHECDWHDFSNEALMALKDLIFDVYSFDVEQAPNLPSTTLESLKRASPCGEESEIYEGIYRHVWQSNNLLKGPLPPELFLLTNLRSVLLAMSDIDGTFPTQVGQLTNLKQLVTWNLGLKGSIPTEVGMLSNLLMQIHFGSFLSGAIPSEMQHLTNLEIMSVTKNQLTSIPESLGLLSKLKDSDLGRNKLSRVPTELGQLTALTALGLYSNNLQDFPSAISSLTSLESLGMWSNPLKASIPTDIGLLTQLKRLFLYDTSLTGSLPSEIGLLSNLTYL